MQFRNREFGGSLVLSHSNILQQQQQAPPSRAAGLLGYGEAEWAVQESLQGQLPAAAFTHSQLRELQLHALIFKHMVCGVNVPPELVLLVRTSVAAHLGSWWRNYHMGYGNSVDPEPGRCRRTDGKKWRCGRDVVPDQKYCERHVHRGRHRPRNCKPPTTSNNFRQQQLSLQAERSLSSDVRGLRSGSPPPCERPSSAAANGLSIVSCTSTSTPLGKMASQLHSSLGGGACESPPAATVCDGRPLRHFFDGRPRGREPSPSPSSPTWPDTEDRSEQQTSSPYAARSSSSKTQLSISLPNIRAEFSCPGGSPRGKLALSPLKLSMSSGEDDDPLGVEAATQMGLGVADRQRQGRNSWPPIAWETGSVGGPLAESGSSRPQGDGTPGPELLQGSGLNLMPDSWESSPPSSSPNGVLQMNATFGCFSSDNSTASSPRSAALRQPKGPAV